jgi:Na+/melibiose symporter-like transporter
MTLGVAPPSKPVDRASSGRFVRAMLARTLVILCPLWIVLLAASGSPTWMLVVAICSVAILVVDIAWLSYRIRRDGRRPTT